MKKLHVLLAVVIVIVFAGLASCTDATRSKLGGYGNQFKVEMVSCDGTTTHQWISTGKVISEEYSDGYYFTDAASDRLIEVTGNLNITKQ